MLPRVDPSGRSQLLLVRNYLVERLGFWVVSKRFRPVRTITDIIANARKGETVKHGPVQFSARINFSLASRPKMNAVIWSMTDHKLIMHHSLT